MKLIALCHDCAHRHKIEFDPVRGPGSAFSDWLVKHPQHRIDFVYPERSGKDTAVDHSWMDYLHNADIKVAYAASSAITITLASLATSSTKLVGRESDAYDNSSNKYLDVRLAGFITVGTTPTTGKSIDVCVVAKQSDSVWPLVFDGTDSAETVVNQEQKDQMCKGLASLSVISTTSDISYPFDGSVASLFGSVLPQTFSVFVTHDTGVNLNATGGNHVVTANPSYATAI